MFAIPAAPQNCICARSQRILYTITYLKFPFPLFFMKYLC